MRKSPIAAASAAAEVGVLVSVMRTSTVVSSTASMTRLAGSVSEIALFPTDTRAPPVIPAFVTLVTATLTEPPFGYAPSLSNVVAGGASPCHMKEVVFRAERSSAPAVTEPVPRISEVDVEPSVNVRSAASVCAVRVTIWSTAELRVTLPVVVIEPSTIASATSVIAVDELASPSITRSAAPRSIVPVTVIERAVIFSWTRMSLRT